MLRSDLLLALSHVLYSCLSTSSMCYYCCRCWVPPPWDFLAVVLLNGRSHWQQVKQLHVPLHHRVPGGFTTVETLQGYLDGLSANTSSSSSSSSSSAAAAEVKLNVLSCKGRITSLRTDGRSWQRMCYRELLE